MEELFKSILNGRLHRGSDLCIESCRLRKIPPATPRDKEGERTAQVEEPGCAKAFRHEVGVCRKPHGADTEGLRSSSFILCPKGNSETWYVLTTMSALEQICASESPSNSDDEAGLEKRTTGKCLLPE